MVAGAAFDRAIALAAACCVRLRPLVNAPCNPALRPHPDDYELYFPGRPVAVFFAC